MAVSSRKGAASLREKITFSKPMEISDGHGGTQAGWQDMLTVPAALKPKFGGNTESVIASRLASRQPYNITIYSSAASRQIAPDWRAHDARAGTTNGKPNRVFGIKSIVNPDMNNEFLELLVIEGEDG